MKFLLVVVLGAILALSQGMDCPAKPCNPAACQLPDCRCSSTDMPGGLSPKDVPQVLNY